MTFNLVRGTMRGMKFRGLALIVLFLAPSVPVWAQACHFGGDKGYDETVKALKATKSCKAAVAYMEQCAWGSSADTGFAPIAIAKCEKTFVPKFSEKEWERYGEEMQLCAYRYARQEGTMSISAAALCQVDVAAQFAENPALADKPAPRASFDCTKARTPLEKAICSDIKLGHADIVLSRVYKDLLQTAGKANRPVVVQSEKEWLQRVPAKCGLEAGADSLATLDCVRNEFEQRFSDIDGCGDDTIRCLQYADTEEMKAPGLKSITGPRASFDCEKPTTPLEIVICADAELGQDDIKLAKAYGEAKTKLTGSDQQGLIDSERKWLQYVNDTCPLGAVGGIPPLLTRLCVRDAYETRIEQLQSCPWKEPKLRMPCFDHFHLSVGK